MQRVFAQTATQLMHLQYSCRRSAAGLTRTEILWTVMLSVVIVGLIVRTLGDELHRGRERYALDSLHYLSSQLYMAMEAAEESGSPVTMADFPFVGPGEVPRGIDVETVSDLSALLPDGVYVPKDPWDRAYVFRLVGRPDNRRAQLLSAGPSGLMPDNLEAAPTYSKPVHGPFTDDT